jgi:hypothetical protein
MGKKVLAIYYSQSGQLGEIIGRFCAPLAEAGAVVETVRIRMADEFPFPWTTKSFFSVMPDCVLGNTAELAPFHLLAERYDLIVLGYQAWFLSPSIPFTSLLQDAAFAGVLKDTPVITVTGARNMWVTAFGRVKKLLRAAGARHVGTIALVDRHLNLVSIFTIFHWMLRGRKDRWLGFFPRPGVADADIGRTREWGSLTAPYLFSGDWEGLQPELVRKRAADPKHHLLFMESKAAILFGIWARWISRRKKKQVWLVAFKYYLLIALFVFAPIVFIIDLFIFRPFFPGMVKSKREACLQLN